MGCIHFMMHKPNLAIYYFNKDTSTNSCTHSPAICHVKTILQGAVEVGPGAHWGPRTCGKGARAGLTQGP